MVYILSLRTQTKGDYFWFNFWVAFSHIRRPTRFDTGTTAPLIYVNDLPLFVKDTIVALFADDCKY